jgi:SAM-dependent methyltransferase
VEKFIYPLMADIESQHFWFRGRRDILQNLMRQKVDGREGKLILDAGCGTGGNLKWLSEFGHVVGLELDEYAASIALGEAPGCVVRAKFPDKIPFKKKTFDIITIFDVIEHIENDSETLFCLAEKLKSDGMMLITVPAFPHLWSGHDVAHHHKRRYLKDQLKGILTGAGLKVEYLSYFNSLLYPVIAVKRIMNRMFSIEDAIDLKVPPRRLNDVLYKTFSSEKKWIGKIQVPFGVSLIAVARPTETLYL